MSPSVPASVDVQRVHLVFKTHLDLGFTALASEVEGQYLDHFIPGALDLARQLRARGGPERFIWTTGSWLLHRALETAAPGDRGQLEAAIAAGDLAWHALPYTVHSELLSPSLFRAALDYSRELDKRFGRRTLAAKMTDVPGHTRGVVPLLSEAGVEFLHLGVNPASTAPDVPDVFRWVSPDGTELIVAYDKQGYGGTVTVPGCPDALCLIHTNDNLGPPPMQAVLDAFDQARTAFPGAQVRASTLDGFALALRAVRETLPVVTSEIGDTWIHGAGSDPTRVRRFRALSRLYDRWLDRGEKVPPNFARALLKVGEHTWGLDVKTFLKDDLHFTPAQLEQARDQPNFRRMEQSWAEQGAYIGAALGALDGTSKWDEAQAVLEDSEPREFTREGLTRHRPGTPLTVGGFGVQVDADGALSSLVPPGSTSWATPEHRLGALSYEVFGARDYDRFYAQYVVQNPSAQTELWAPLDFTKPGLGAVLQQGRRYSPTLSALWVGADRLLLELDFSQEAHDLGAPGTVQIQVSLDGSLAHWDVCWLHKPASRVAEALWLGFSPPVPDPARWTMDKLGQPVSPLDVVPGGNRRLHAVGTGVSYGPMDAETPMNTGTVRPVDTVTWQLQTLDAPLVAPGGGALLEFCGSQPPLERGLDLNLYNNVWGTNFRMWYGEAARFRVMLRGPDEGHLR